MRIRPARGRRRRALLAIVATFTATATVGGVAQAEFPYGGSGSDYSSFKVGDGVVPNDIEADEMFWKLAGSPEDNSTTTADPKELFGVRGSRVVDDKEGVDTAWQTTTGRPDVVIAVLDSGIRWDEKDLPRKVRLNTGELPRPRSTGPAQEAGTTCSEYVNQPSDFDANRDGVVNTRDWACDPAVDADPPNGTGQADRIEPQDLLIAFSNGDDADDNGFVDDIAGWDFLDNDNDAWDDVRYNHGTGEARGSSGEANEGEGQTGACPNCMFMPMRVGDSFVADVNRFAQAVVYGVDNGALVIQEALGTLNKSGLGRDAVEYAYDHGVTVIASAADEAAQHHNWPSSYPHVIMVNSADSYLTDLGGLTYPSPAPPNNHSYLQFNGCTNFFSKVTLAIPSTSCSSDATAVAAGFAGLLYSAALNARQKGLIANLPDSLCERPDGGPCAVSANEVRQLMASGTVNRQTAADDINFISPPPSLTQPPGPFPPFPQAPPDSGPPELACPAPDCTDPNALGPLAASNRPLLGIFPKSTSYPARRGFDEFYGYGRPDVNRTVDWLQGEGANPVAKIPPQAEIVAPDWYTMVDPGQGTLDVRGQVSAPRAPGGRYKCQLLVAPGTQPNNATTDEGGDFEPVAGPDTWCDGTTERDRAFDGPLGRVDINALKARYPPTLPSDFNGAEDDIRPPNFNGRPNAEPYSFTVKVVVTALTGGGGGGQTPVEATGEDRRQMFLHRDQDMLEGWPKQLAGDVEASPVLADLDGDNRNELVVANSDGFIHAFRRDGSQLPGFPIRVDSLPLHRGGRAFRSGEVSDDYGGAILASPAVADLDRDGAPEIVVANLEGKVVVLNEARADVLELEADPKFSGKPLEAFENVRKGPQNRTQHGFLGSPVLADLDRNDEGRLEIIAAGMDRHVYAWNDDGTPVSGFPTLVVDPEKVTAIDPVTHAVTFDPAKTGDPGDFQQGAIIDTPAVGDLDGADDGRPEILVGTNEEYDVNADGGQNIGNAPSATPVGLILQPGNGRLYALKADGDPDGKLLEGDPPWLAGWPFKVGILYAGLLPVVGEGITGSPILAEVDCPSGGGGPKVGVVPAVGAAYIVNPDANSCHGKGQGGKDNALAFEFSAGARKYDTPTIPAVGHPAFGNLGPGAPSFLTPVAGLQRAADAALNEYQGGQDFLGAWNSETGQYRPGWPSPLNDLQFLTGPSIGDIDDLPGEEVVSASASLDLVAFNAAGVAVNDRWPKLTSDWTVANPALGSFGTIDTEEDAGKVVIGGTRSGLLLAYSTDASACSPSSWPRFHHDNANSGDYRRDAISPGRPMDARVEGADLKWRAPGDDLLCGTAASYEAVTSAAPIDERNFDDATPLEGEPEPAEAGTEQSMALPEGHPRYVAIRALDEDGANVGRPAVVDTAPPAATTGGTGTGTGTGTGGTGRPPTGTTGPTDRPTTGNATGTGSGGTGSTTGGTGRPGPGESRPGVGGSGPGGALARDERFRVLSRMRCRGSRRRLRCRVTGYLRIQTPEGRRRPARAACTGGVRLRITGVGRTRVRYADLSRSCSYNYRFTLTRRGRLPRRLRIGLRFAGNQLVGPVPGPTRRVRVLR